ncbi:MAG: protein translocase subunit SecD, partial [Sphaerochaetaceae bacterium]|nr:protein translocase subunit SecD [Sphaerochaetaceae bacterium]
MKKRGRLFIVLLVAVVCGIFLYPTVKWYVFVPQETKDLATGSMIQIREYALGQATIDLRELKSLIASDSSASLPDTYGFLIPVAKDNYKSMKRNVPKSWTVEDVFRGFYNEQELFDALENHYRSQLLSLKTLSGKILQLGLDLRGGMSILLEADVDAYAAKTGTRVSSSVVTALLNEDIAILNERIDQFGVTEPDIRLQGNSQILIEIPGAADPERVKSFLRGKRSLNFQIVDQELTAQLNTYFNENPGDVFTNVGQIKQPEFLPAGKVATGYYVNDAYGLDQLS